MEAEELWWLSTVTEKWTETVICRELSDITEMGFRFCMWCIEAVNFSTAVDEFQHVLWNTMWAHLATFTRPGWRGLVGSAEDAGSRLQRGSGNLALSHPKLACQYWLHLWKENSDRCEMPAYLTLIWALHSDKISLIKVTQSACFRVQLLWSSCCVLVSPRVNEL